MSAGVNQAGVSVDSADYTVDGTFIGVAPGGGGLFLAAYLTARNTATATAQNTTANTASNTWSG